MGSILWWLWRRLRPRSQPETPRKHDPSILSFTAPPDAPLLTCVQDLIKAYGYRPHFYVEGYDGRKFEIRYEPGMNQIHVAEFTPDGDPTDLIELSISFRTHELTIRHGFADFVNDRRGSRWELVLEAYSETEGLPLEQQVGIHRQLDLIDALTHSIMSSGIGLAHANFVHSIQSRGSKQPVPPLVRQLRALLMEHEPLRTLYFKDVFGRTFKIEWDTGIDQIDFVTFTYLGAADLWINVRHIGHELVLRMADNPVRDASGTWTLTLGFKPVDTELQQMLIQMLSEATFAKVVITQPYELVFSDPNEM